MSILNKLNIENEIEKGRIIFDPPLQNNQVNGASVDLTLGDEFRVFTHRASAIDIRDNTDYKRYTELRKKSSFIIRPQETVIGITAEKITLPDNICGWLEGRSRFARLGLLIHISAGLIHPGADNRQVLEITNLSPNTLRLHSGVAICQLILEYTNGSIAYRGRYQTQMSP